MTRPGINTICTALKTLLQDADDLEFVPDHQIQEWDKGIDFDSGEIIVAPPGILIAYDAGSYTPANHDNSAYKIDERFTLIAVAQDLSGFAGSQAGAYAIIEAMKAVIVSNRRLTIDAATNKRVSLVLLGTAPFENLFYQNGCAAIGLQIQATGSTWDYADA